MKKDSLEDLFKKSFENFEGDVNSDVWPKIENGLKGAGVGAIVKSTLKKAGAKIIIAVLSASIILVTTFLLINNEDKKTVTKPKKEIVPDYSKPIIVKQTEQEKTSENITSEAVHIEKEKNETKKPAIKTEKIKGSITKTKEKGTADSIKNVVHENLSSIIKFSEFSPNGDGLNDEFIFQSKNITNMKVIIYDKDANAVYTYRGIDGKWDGKNLNGENAAEGYYLYMISAEGAAGKKYEQKGKVKLTR